MGGLGVGGLGGGKGGHKRTLSVEEKMKAALEREHDVPLDLGKLQSEAAAQPNANAPGLVAAGVVVKGGIGKSDVRKKKSAVTATVNNRFSTFSAISESSQEGSQEGHETEDSRDSKRPGTQSSQETSGSDGSSSQNSYGNNEPLAVMASPMAMDSEESVATATASDKEVEAGVGYGLGRSDSLESEESSIYSAGIEEGRLGRIETVESNYSAGIEEALGRRETFESGDGRGRSATLRSRWGDMDVEDYYGIERFETEAQGPRDGLAGGGGPGASAEALESEETLVRTESSSSSVSGRSGKTVGKAI